MNSIEKSKFTLINKIDEFNSVIRRLCTNEELSNNEKSYILSCAITFIKYYESNRQYSSYWEIGYYIILKYSITYEDYLPLYDFSINFGFYPISKDIINNKKYFKFRCFIIIIQINK